VDDDLESVEEALRHAAAVPEAERGVAWQRYVDGLLDKRVRLARTAEQGRETRVVFSGESR
jgi:hypothetical protein